MYLPRPFEQASLEQMHALVAAHPLGALVVHGDAGLTADHIPFELAPATPDAPFGILRAHVARSNPVWRADGSESLVIFQGPHAYISPEYYEEKAVTGKAVPTWNYAVAHVHGTLRAVDDPAWLLGLLERLTDRHEAARPQPWKVADAPRDYIDALLKAVVGIEIVVTRMEGKWKASQHRPQRDRARIVAGLAQDAGTAGMAALMAGLPERT
jgi:transcriptional regulator